MTRSWTCFSGSIHTRSALSLLSTSSIHRFNPFQTRTHPSMNFMSLLSATSCQSKLTSCENNPFTGFLAQSIFWNVPHFPGDPPRTCTGERLAGILGILESDAKSSQESVSPVGCRMNKTESSTFGTPQCYTYAKRRRRLHSCMASSEVTSRTPQDVRFG